MGKGRRSLQRKSGTEELGQVLGACSGDGKSRALFWTVQRKTGKDDRTAWGNASSDLVNIATALIIVGEKVQYRSVVPESNGFRGYVAQQITLEKGGSIANSGLRLKER